MSDDRCSTGYEGAEEGRMTHIVLVGCGKSKRERRSA
jgi:hypothetical protein